MHYVSTRNPDTRLSAAQAIVQGLSRDGGLFLPEEIPQISLEDIKALSLLPYPARAAKLMKLYLDEFTEEELLRFAEKAYGAAKFDDPKAAPVKPLGQLTDGIPLPEKNRDHALTGNCAGCRECHIQPDWLLIYEIAEDTIFLYLTRTGSHSELFER